MHKHDAVLMTGPKRFASAMQSRWGPWIGLASWVLIIVALALLSRNDVGGSHTVEVVALLLGAVAVIGWFLLARRARCRIPR
jgi:hypothetical protein